TQNPARYSLDSRNGPSVNIAVPSRLSTTVALLVVPRPPANTQCPSAWSCSLNASIAAASPEVAVGSGGSAVTATRYCIASSPALVRAGGRLRSHHRVPSQVVPSWAPLTPSTSATVQIRHPGRRSHPRAGYSGAVTHRGSHTSRGCQPSERRKVLMP